jgi:hypothetical protein
MQKWLYPFTSICAVLLLIVYHLLNEVPVDSGDGLAHYFIAKNAFYHPSDLLNHWGKPVFTALSAPFAYFGFQVYVFFNILIFALTLFVGNSIFKHFEIKNPLMAIFPLVLLGSLDYTANILGGMTEILFGFLTLLSGLLLLQKRWVWFALLISFMPFVRSEGQLLIPLGILILLYFKAWKSIPLLFVGFLFYAIIGAIALGNFWWYFTENPYQGAAEIYGQGDWLHYINNWHLHLGVPALVLLVFGLLAFVWGILRKSYTSEKQVSLFYFAAVYFGIVLVHAYLWAQGKNGALGLSRLAIHGLPGLMLICILAIDATPIKRWMNSIFTALMLILSVLYIRDYPLVYDQPFPKKAMPDERAVVDATSAVMDYLEDHKTRKVYYYHPLVAYKAGTNLKDQRGQFEQKSFGLFETEYTQLHDGDLIIWDSHFAGRDMNFPEELTSRFEELFVFTPFNQMVHKGDAVAQVKVLRVNKAKKNSFVSLQATVDSTLHIAADSLYTNLPRINNTGQTATYQLQITNRSSSGGQLYFVVQHDASGQALTFELDTENTWKFSLPSDLLGEYKVFVHNPEGVIGEVEVLMERALVAGQ